MKDQFFKLNKQLILNNFNSETQKIKQLKFEDSKISIPNF